MKIVTVLCIECSGYFEMEAFEPADLKNPVCETCKEILQEDGCAHEHTRVIYVNAGICSETGYHDESELIECRVCGFQEVA